MSKYNSIEDVIKAKDALLNILFEPAVTVEEGLTVMQQIRKDALITFMTNDLSHGNLEYDVVQKLTRDLVLGLNGSKEKVGLRLMDYISEAIDLYNDLEADGLKNLPASTLDNLFTEEFHPDLLEVFDIERKMYTQTVNYRLNDFPYTAQEMKQAGLEKTPGAAIPGRRIKFRDEDIVTMVQQIVKNEIHHSIRHVMPESFEMRTILVNHPQIHRELGAMAEAGQISKEILDDLYTFKIYGFEVNGYEDFYTALAYLDGEFKKRAPEFIYGTKSNNRFYKDDIQMRTTDKYFAYLGYGSYEDSFYHKFNTKINQMFNEIRKEIKNENYEELVTKKIEEAGFVSESEMLDYAAGRDYGQYELGKNLGNYEGVNAQYNEILQVYNDTVEEVIYSKMGDLIDMQLIEYGKYGVFTTKVDNATEIPVNSKLPVFVSEIKEQPVIDTPTNVVDDAPKQPKVKEPKANIKKLTQINLQIQDPDGLHARPIAMINDYLTEKGITAYVKHKGTLKPFSFIRVLTKGIKYNETFEIYFPKDVNTELFVDNMILLGVGDEVNPRGGTIRTGDDVISNHSTRVRNVATQYHNIMGLEQPEFKPAVVFSEELGAAAADIFDQLPMFDEAALPYYKNFIEETNVQYQLLLEGGLEFEIVDYDPYTPNRSGHNQMITDMENGRLKVLATDTGFGDDTTDIRNPMLAESKHTDVRGRVMLENDVFRAVHDTFGHGMRGNTFGPIGEYNAWLAHKEMYSRDAQRVMTTETLGQNTYTNYGQHMRDVDGNLIPKGDPNYIKPGDRPFAPQKVAIAPEPLIDAAATVVEDAVDLVDNESMNKVTQLANTNPEVANNLWNQSKKIVGKTFNVGTGVLDPGDVILTQGMARMLPRLGLAAISGPALAAYMFYELSVLAVDAVQAIDKARQNQGIELLDYDNTNSDIDWKQLGKDAWSEFGDVSDTWSLSWKISEPIINKAFESYGKLDNRLYEAAMEAK